MSAGTAYGGWVFEPPTGTGGALGFVKKIGWAVACGAVLSHGTGGEVSIAHLQNTFAPHIASASIAEFEAPRSPSEDLARIREVFSPSISDLATIFGVTRQSVYNWINGEPVAEGNASKLKDLAQAADILKFEKVGVTPALLKRKFANGKTLFQVAQAGESVQAGAFTLVESYKREAIQRERMRAVFANRAKSPATADFDLPAPNDNA